MHPRSYVAYIIYVCNTLQNSVIGWHGGDELLNKVVIFVFLAHKKIILVILGELFGPWNVLFELAELINFLR